MFGKYANSYKFRAAERKSFCRVCDNVIEKGDNHFYTNSLRNRGQNIHICLPCINNIGAEYLDLYND